MFLKFTVYKIKYLYSICLKNCFKKSLEMTLFKLNTNPTEILSVDFYMEVICIFAYLHTPIRFRSFSQCEYAWIYPFFICCDCSLLDSIVISFLVILSFGNTFHPSVYVSLQVFNITHSKQELIFYISAFIQWKHSIYHRHSMGSQIFYLNVI